MYLNIENGASSDIPNLKTFFQETRFREYYSMVEVYGVLFFQFQHNEHFKCSFQIKLTLSPRRPFRKKLETYCVLFCRNNLENNKDLQQDQFDQIEYLIDKSENKCLLVTVNK